MTEDEAYETLVKTFEPRVIAVLNELRDWRFPAEIVREIRKNHPNETCLDTLLEYILPVLAIRGVIERCDIPDPDPDHTLDRMLSKRETYGYALSSFVAGEKHDLPRYRLVRT